MNKIRTESKTILTIDSNLEDVALVAAVTKILCSRLPIEEIACKDIELSVCEAVNNAVIHAYGNEEGHKVVVAFTVRRDVFVIEVCDQGKPMAEHESPSVVYNTNDRRFLPESGMGLFLIRELMDDVVYKTKDHTNILSMTRRLER